MLPASSAVSKSRPLSPITAQWWIIVALLFSLIPEGMAVSIFGRTPVISIFDIALLAIVLYLVFRGVVGKFSFDLSDKPVLLLSLAFLITQLTSLLFSLRDVQRGFLAVKVFTFGYLTYLLCVSTLKCTRDVQRVVLGLIVWGGTVGLLLVYYYLTNWSSTVGQEANYEAKGEIGIAMGRSNYLAALLVPILPVAIAGLFSYRRFLRIAIGVCVGLILVGLLITMSKGAFLSIVIGSLCAGPMIWKAGLKLRHAAIFLAAVVCFFLLVLLIAPDLLIFNYGMLLYRLDAPDYSRLELWKVAWEAFVTHPLFGIGPNSMYIYNRQFADDVLYSHNFILSTLSELGLAGGVSFFLLLGVLIRRSYRLCLSTLADPKLKHIALGLFVGLLSTLAHGLVEPTFPGQQYEVIFWICMALVYVYQQILKKSVLAGTADANLLPAQLTLSNSGVRS
jgi:O-antigen ligase